MQFGSLWLEEWAVALSPNPAEPSPKASADSVKSVAAPKPAETEAKANGVPSNDPSRGGSRDTTPNGVHASPVSTVSSGNPSPAVTPVVATGGAVPAVPAPPAPPGVKLSWAQRVAANTPAVNAPPKPSSAATPSPPPVRPVAVPPLPERRIRGLVNGGNTCFINVILQALIACNPFRRFLLGCRNLESNTPLMKKFVSLAVDMTIDGTNLSPKAQLVNLGGKEAKSSKKQLPNLDEPLIPDWCHDIFPSSLPSTVPRPTANGGNSKGRRRGSQEDAEEFLSFLLNKLHEELLASGTPHADVEANGFVSGGALDLKSTSGTNGAPKNVDEKKVEDEGWQEMNRKGRPVQVRDSVTSPTAISKIFGGVLRSELKRQRAKASVTREPFLMLGLDIDSGMIRHVDDALAAYFKTEHVEGITAEDSQETVEAKKQVLLESLPPVLILHLKRFSHNPRTGALNKVSRQLDYPEELSIPASNIYGAKATQGAKDRVYRLTSVVTHLGKEMAGGHYLCDVRIGKGLKQVWAQCDDSKVSAAIMQSVLRRQAYLLFYTRTSVED